MGEVPRIELPTEVERRWDELRRRYRRLLEAADAALTSAHGMSLSEYTALAALAFSDDGGHLRQQVLTEAVGLNQSSMSRLVQRLEHAGYTRRYHCDTDRRGVYTQITEEGRAVVVRARSTYLAVLSDLDAT